MSDNPNLASDDLLDELEAAEEGGEFIEILDGDELIRIPVGPDSARLWANRAMDATLQKKAWEAELGRCKSVLDKLQADAKGSYETNFGTVIATRRNPTTKVEVDMAKLLQEELTPEEEHALVIAAKGFDWKAVDPGLKDSKSGEKLKGWKPTTRLGEYALAAAEEKKDRSGFMLVELGRKYL